MPETITVLVTPGLNTFLKNLKQKSVEANIQDLISLLKRRQIRSSRLCAVATARLLQRVVAANRISDGKTLIKRVTDVGRQLTAAQPREIAVGNVVRRVLGVIREEVGEDRKGRSSAFSETETATDGFSEQADASPDGSHQRHGLSPLSQSMELPPEDPGMSLSTHASILTERDQSFRPTLANSQPSMVQSMFSLLSHPVSSTASPVDSPRPGASSPAPHMRLTKSVVDSLGGGGTDLRAEVLEGIEEIIDELNIVDDQIAAYATEHIHSNEIILTQGASSTVQKFLLQAARKRKFTVIHAEAYPNDHRETHAAVMGKTKDSLDDDELDMEAFSKPLIASGVTVVVIPDATVFALMSRVNKVILGTHVVVANGGLVAQAGAKAIAKAASVHKVPVVVLSGVYKLSPLYPFDFESLIEHGDPGRVLGFDDGDLIDKVEVENPLYDYVPPELVDLYITNLGGHAPSYLYRIVADHYNVEDNDLARFN